MIVTVVNAVSLWGVSGLHCFTLIIQHGATIPSNVAPNGMLLYCCKLKLFWASFQVIKDLLHINHSGIVIFFSECKWKALKQRCIIWLKKKQQSIWVSGVLTLERWVAWLKCLNPSPNTTIESPHLKVNLKESKQCHVKQPRHSVKDSSNNKAKKDG